MAPRALSSNPSAGSLSAPSPGSTAAAGSPRTGKTATTMRSPSSTWHQSASCSEGSAILHEVFGRTHMGFSPSSRIYNFIASFSFLLRIRSLSPSSMRRTVPTSTHIRSGIIYPNHDPSFSRALGSREGGIHLFETAYRSHVRPRSPPNLGSGGSEALIRGFEAARESDILPNLDLQFGSLRDEAQCHVTPKCD